MNKIEVISRNTFINDFSNNISLFGDENTLAVKISGIIDNNIIFINNVYSKVIFITDDNARASIFEIKDNTKGVFSYQYVINNNSKLVINKFYYMKDYNEDNNIDLDGYKAEVLFNLSVISDGLQKYNINVNHHNKDTVSKLNNHGVSIDNGMIEFIVNGKVEKGMTNSSLNQDNKIMTMEDGKGIIKPNLYINEDIVEARHGASIGKFDEDEVFYMEARGIPKDVGYQLLLRGFLLGKLPIDEELSKELDIIIEKVRR